MNKTSPSFYRQGKYLIEDIGPEPNVWDFTFEKVFQTRLFQMAIQQYNEKKHLQRSFRMSRQMKRHIKKNKTVTLQQISVRPVKHWLTGKVNMLAYPKTENHE